MPRVAQKISVRWQRRNLFIIILGEMSWSWCDGCSFFVVVIILPLSVCLSCLRADDDLGVLGLRPFLEMVLAKGHSYLPYRK